MDPITHLMVGIGLATLSCTPLAAGNPVYAAAVLGALAPDLDVILRCKGEINYLFRHRAASHSLPGALFWAGLVSLMMTMVFPDAGLGSIFLWSLAGSFSHLALDFFNPHGIKFWWPFKNTRVHWSLLNGFDPVLLMVTIISIILFQLKIAGPAVFPAAGCAYLILRWLMSVALFLTLKKAYASCLKKRIILMPSLFSLWKWDFLIDHRGGIIAGEIFFPSRRMRIRKALVKSRHPMIRRAMAHGVGRRFADFTPYFYVHPVTIKDKETVLEFIDLRYRFRETFLHSALAFFNAEEELEKAFFFPFSRKRRFIFVH